MCVFMYIYLYVYILIAKENQLIYTSNLDFKKSF